MARTRALVTSREQLLHALYEAAELEHTLMCTYLYAAFSLKDGEAEGLTPEQASAVARWRSTIMQVAIDEMSHLTAVWNITVGLGGTPRFGRGNFPIDPGALPTGLVVKLTPFSEAALQHFIFLERPFDSPELDGDGFTPELKYAPGTSASRLTPMGLDYETVGAFYVKLADDLRTFVAEVGESAAFVGDSDLSLSQAEVSLAGAQPVLCTKTALAAFTTIIEQGEGASVHAEDSHYQRFLSIRDELSRLKQEDPDFSPAHPSATNPVLRRPIRAEGRVWLQDEEAAATVDLANTGYALMLRLLAYAYTIRRPSPEKSLVVDLGLGLMRAVTYLAERAARLPAGSSNPGCNAGVSFTALRDASPLSVGAAARRFFLERLREMDALARRLAAAGDARTRAAARVVTSLLERATLGFAEASVAGRTLPAYAPAFAHSASPLASAHASSQGAPKTAPPTPHKVDGVDEVEGDQLTLLYEGRKCIHARFCVTGAPKVFLANVVGPWIHPDAMPVERLVEIAHACPSGAIRYRRTDGHADEQPPPVNLIAVRESGPYAVRAAIELDGLPHPFRATLCRCGASKRKPFCDGSHHEVAFSASGEPATQSAEMLPVRDGKLEIRPETDGPLHVRGNVEITSGTGRVVSRLTSARLCRCGASGNKPFCDRSHVRIGFRSS